jgi:poly(3-hydroxybutyrate) depolymerase
MAAHYPRIIGTGAFQSSAASNTHTIGGTSGISEPGDLILIFLESANQAFTAPVGGGYIALASSPQGTGTAGAANATRLTVFYKISNGAETTYVTGDSGDHNCVASLVLRGVDLLNPINATAGNTAAASTTITLPAVTTTVPECLIILAVATDRDLNSAATFSNPVNANLANFVERIDSTTNTGQGGGLGIYTAEKGTAGTTGTTNITQAVSEETGRITIAIAPLRRRIAVT